MVSVRWTGAAGLEFTHGDSTILIDPYVSRPGKIEVFFKRPRPKSDVVAKYAQGLPGELSAVVVSHTHLDHALDIPELSRHFDGPLVGSKSLEALMAMHGVPDRVTVCEGGERVELPGGAAVTMIRSQHGLVVFGRVPYAGEIDPNLKPPLRARDYRHGTVFTVKLEIGGVTFMHAGSANFVESELEGHHCDVLFMCVPGWKRSPGYSTLLPEIVKPRVIMPFHYDDFSAPIRPGMKAPRVPVVDMPGFIRQVALSAPQARVRPAQTLEPMTFPES